MKGSVNERSNSLIGQHEWSWVVVVVMVVGRMAEKEGGKQGASTQPKYSGGDVRDDEHD